MTSVPAHKMVFRLNSFTMALFLFCGVRLCYVRLVLSKTIVIPYFLNAPGILT